MPDTFKTQGIPLATSKTHFGEGKSVCKVLLWLSRPWVLRIFGFNQPSVKSIDSCESVFNVGIYLLCKPSNLRGDCSNSHENRSLAIPTSFWWPVQVLRAVGLAPGEAVQHLCQGQWVSEGPRLELRLWDGSTAYTRDLVCCTRVLVSCWRC